jgi:hypothetical protein
MKQKTKFTCKIGKIDCSVKQATILPTEQENVFSYKTGGKKIVVQNRRLCYNVNGKLCHVWRQAVANFVEALRYKKEGRGFDSRCNI